MPGGNIQNQLHGFLRVFVSCHPAPPYKLTVCIKYSREPSFCQFSNWYFISADDSALINYSNNESQ